MGTLISRGKEKEARKKRFAEVNPLGNWKIVVTRHGKYELTPNARRVFCAMFRLHQEGMDLEPDVIFREAGFPQGYEPEERRIDRLFRRCKAWDSDGKRRLDEPGKKGAWARDNSRLVGSAPARRGFYQINL